MEIHIRLKPLQYAVFVPIGLTDSQLVSMRHKRCDVLRFMSGIWNFHDYVDDRLGGETRYRSGSNVLNTYCDISENSLDACSFLLEQLRPRRIIFGEVDL